MHYIFTEKDFKLSKKHRYESKNYTAPKNAKPVVYKGKQYQSKAQCMAIERISAKQLNEYLKNV